MNDDDVIRHVSETPFRPSRTRRRPASVDMLDDLLDEMEIVTVGDVSYELMSTWAAKHVWRVDVDEQPFAFVRYLLGPAEEFPDRWRPLRLGPLLNEARIGPRVLGITESSEALGGRAAMVEAALVPLAPGELADRAGEALALMARLHSNGALIEALSEDFNEADRQGTSPFAALLAETRERWFDAVVERWLEVGMYEINDLKGIVSDLISQVQSMPVDIDHSDFVVPSHNDPNEGNFMANRQGALRMIDFEGLALNNPVADVGVFLAWFIEPQHHRGLLEENYSLVDAGKVLERMQIWVPLRYINIAAHWAARLTRAEDAEQWEYAISSLHQWVRGTAEFIYKDVPAEMDEQLQLIIDLLYERTEWATPAEGEADDTPASEDNKT